MAPFCEKNLSTNENKVHIMGDLGIPLWNASSKLGYHGNTNTSMNIFNYKINEP